MSRHQQVKEQFILGLLISISVGAIIGGFWWASGGNGSNLISRLSQQVSKSTKKSLKKAYRFIDVDNVPSGVFHYGGSITWNSIRRKVDPVIQLTWSQYKLSYTDSSFDNPDSSNGIEMLLENKLAFAHSSRSIQTKEQEQAKQQGFLLEQIPIAIDGIAVGVHPDLDIPGITVAQLQDIYTGKLTNWKEINGPDLPIIPYSRHKRKEGMIAFFAENVLANKYFGSHVKLVRNTTEGIEKTALQPGSIYYDTAAAIVPQCQIRPLPIGRTENKFIPPYQEPFIPLSQCQNQHNQVDKVAIQKGKYPITRQLFVVVKQNGQDEERAGKAYASLLLTDEGQQLIDQAGFVRIK